jgi:hypothetical protein
MRNSLIIAVGIIIGSVSSSGAMVLKDCSKLGQKKKIECLNDNVNMLYEELKNLRAPSLDGVVLEYSSGGSHGSCITYLGGGKLTVADTCADPNKNKFNIRSFSGQQ